MQFDVITTFPDAFTSYVNASILKRAQARHLVSIHFHDLRQWGKGRYRQLDDAPYGGGAGMVLMAEPILRAHAAARAHNRRLKTKTIVFSAKGKEFTQKLAHDWAARYDQLIFISGRYEGIDERVTHALRAEEISIGKYVLTDGDVAAMAVMSAVARLIPGVIKLKSLQEESHWNLLCKDEATMEGGLEYPHYTRPEVLEWKGRRLRVPKILLSGNHARIAKWRQAHRKRI